MDAVEQLEAAVRREANPTEEASGEKPSASAPMTGATLLKWSAPYAVMVAAVSTVEYMFTLGVGIGGAVEGVVTIFAIATLLVTPLLMPLIALVRSGSRRVLVLGLHSASIAFLGLTHLNASSMAQSRGMFTNVATEVGIAWLIVVLPVVLLLFGLAALLRRRPRKNRWEDV